MSACLVKGKRGNNRPFDQVWSSLVLWKTAMFYFSFPASKLITTHISKSILASVSSSDFSAAWIICSEKQQWYFPVSLIAFFQKTIKISPQEQFIIKGAFWLRTTWARGTEKEIILIIFTIFYILKAANIKNIHMTFVFKLEPTCELLWYMLNRLGLWLD